MTTWYSSDIALNGNLNFREYARKCVGYFVRPFDGSTLDETLEQLKAHGPKLEAAQEELKRLEELPPDGRRELAASMYQQDVQTYEKRAAEKKAQVENLRAVERAVKALKDRVGTKAPQQLKSLIVFMISDLQRSLSLEAETYNRNPPERQSDDRYHQRALEDARQAVNNHMAWLRRAEAIQKYYDLIDEVLPPDEATQTDEESPTDD